MGSIAAIMGKNFWTSWTASNSMLLRALTFLLFTSASLLSCRAEALTGAILSNHSGQGAHASGTIEMATRNKIYTLYYGEPLPRRFKSDVCSEIGAIWSVDVRTLPDSTLYVERASCSGQVQHEEHAGWLLVREYLELLRNGSASYVNLLSSRLRSSADFNEYQTKTSHLDLSSYYSFGRRGGCIEVTSVHHSDRLQLRAGTDCYIEISGMPFDMVFNLLRNRRTGRWEINEIKIE